MPLNPRTRCLYTLKPLGELVQRSREHVIFSAVGGPNAYSVDADKPSNEWFGHHIDAPFLESFLVKMFRHSESIKAQSGGIPDLVFKGTTADGE